MSVPADVKEALQVILNSVVNDADVIAIVDDRVWLHAPQVPTQAFITGRIANVVNASSKGMNAQNATLTFTYWCRSDERGDSTLYDIWDAVYNVLQNFDTTLNSGARVVCSNHISTNFQIHQDGLTHFASDSYNLIIS